MTETVEATTETQKHPGEFLQEIAVLTRRYHELMDVHKRRVLTVQEKDAVNSITEQLKRFVKNISVRDEWHLTTEPPESYEYLICINGYDFNEMELAITGTARGRGLSNSIYGFGHLFSHDTEIRNNVRIRLIDEEVLSRFAALALSEEWS